MSEQLDNSVEENEKLREEIEELKRRLGIGVVVAVEAETQQAAPPPSAEVDYEPTVVVTDLSEEERKRMMEERNRIGLEREKIREDRKKMEEDIEAFNEERKKFQEERVMLQGEVTNLTKVCSHCK